MASYEVFKILHADSDYTTLAVTDELASSNPTLDVRLHLHSIYFLFSLCFLFLFLAYRAAPH